MLKRPSFCFLRAMLAAVPGALGVLCLTTTEGQAQTPVLPNAAPRATTSIVPGSNIGAPSLRFWGGTATDGNRMFIFGGRSSDAAGNAGSTYFNGLYAFDPVAGTWATLSAEGDPTAPAARFRCAMAYDPITNRIVVFGGRASPTGTIFGDTYAFDLNAGTWSQLAVGGTSPPARFDARMASDLSSAGLVLFGGQQGSSAATRAGDTWVLVGNSWLQLAPTTAPSARSIYAMTSRALPYNDVVLIGGRNTSDTRLSDVWRWDGVNQQWAQVVSADGSIPVSFGGGNDAVYNELREVVVMINGTGHNIAPSNITGAGSWTSEYDCVNNVWRAFASDAVNQAAEDPVIGRLQRFYVAWLLGSTYAWGGQNPASAGDVNLPFVRSYQANPIAGTASVGTGCNDSSGLPLSLAADGRPWTGRTVSLVGSGFNSAGLAALVIGSATQNLPLRAVVPEGGLGCRLLVTVDSLQFLPVAGGQVTVPIAVPYNPNLAGLTVYAQLFGIEFGMQGGIRQVSSTQGIGGTVGAL